MVVVAGGDDDGGGGGGSGSGSGGGSDIDMPSPTVRVWRPFLSWPDLELVSVNSTDHM